MNWIQPLILAGIFCIIVLLSENTFVIVFNTCVMIMWMAISGIELYKEIKNDK